MAKYYIWFNDFQNQAIALQQISRKLAGLENRLISIARAMDDRASSMASLKKQVWNVGRNIPDIQDRINLIGKTGLEIKNIYLCAEKDSYYSFEEFMKKSGWFNTAIKFFGKAGYLGSTLSYALKPFENWVDHGVFSFSTKTGAAKVVDIFKSTNSALKGLNKWRESSKGLNKTSLSKLIGTNDIMKGSASTAKSWGKRFFDNFKKNFDDELSKYTKGGAKAAFKWADVILTGIVNAVDNRDEVKSGEISKIRRIKETIVETVIDIGKYALISTTVTAGMAATVSAAPVVAVGVVTTAGIMGLDFIANKATDGDKDFTEIFLIYLLMEAKRYLIQLVMEANLYLKKVKA